MSEQIPESIPTSQDPRSKRPVKKRALTPSSATAATISSLFAKPERALQAIDSSTNSARAPGAPVGAPPEIVANVQGSSAGAGSGEFHVYKASRRREFARVKAMDEEVERERADEVYEREKREREERDREATERKRKKREMRKKGKGKGKDTNGGEQKDGTSGDKVGSLKPRADVGKVESAAGVSVAQALEVAKEEGLIIHDDD